MKAWHVAYLHLGGGTLDLFHGFFALLSRKIFTRFSFEGKPTVIGPKDGKGTKEEKHEANVLFKHENKLSEEIQYLYQAGETIKMASLLLAFRETNTFIKFHLFEYCWLSAMSQTFLRHCKNATKDFID